MRDRDEIVRVAKALAAELEELTDEDHVELLLQRLHDAKRGFPAGGTPPMAVDDGPCDPFAPLDGQELL